MLLRIPRLQFHLSLDCPSSGSGQLSRSSSASINLSPAACRFWIISLNAASSFSTPISPTIGELVLCFNETEDRVRDRVAAVPLSKLRAQQIAAQIEGIVSAVL
jgi:hypothetical protein